MQIESALVLLSSRRPMHTSVGVCFATLSLELSPTLPMINHTVEKRDLLA